MESNVAKGGSSRRARGLDALAYTVSTVRPIYAYAHTASSLRQITKEELCGAIFRAGGQEMHFVDGRPPIRHLAADANHISAVIQALKAAAPE
jgi:hypothetical protein